MKLVKSSQLTSKHFVVAIISGSALIVAILWLLALFTFPHDTPAAILHYSSGVGIDFIGEGSQIVVLPITATALLILNIFMWWWLRLINRKTSWIIISILPVLEIMLLTAYVLLWRLNS